MRVCATCDTVQETHKEAQVNPEDDPPGLREPIPLSTRAIPQRVDQLEDAVMNLAKLYEELKRTLVANNIHPPMPGHASPADPEAAAPPQEA